MLLLLLLVMMMILMTNNANYITEEMNCEKKNKEKYGLYAVINIKYIINKIQSLFTKRAVTCRDIRIAAVYA